MLHWGWVSAPRPVAERLEGVAAGDRCLCIDYALLDDGGVSVESHDVTVQATVADATRAALLGVETGEPILLFEQVIRNEAGEAIDFAVDHLRREVRPHFAFAPRADAAGFGGGGPTPGGDG